MKLFELIDPVKSMWHMVEADKLRVIKQQGLRPTRHGIRGVKHKEPSIFLFTSLDPDVIEEIETLVRFGGIDFENDELMDERNDVKLVILKIDTQKVKEFDTKHHLNRKWSPDTTVSRGSGVITNNPIPPKAITVERMI